MTETKEFSDTQAFDDPCLPCQQWNWFMVDFKTPQPIEFSVNGQEHTGVLPNSKPYKLKNSLKGTTGKLTLTYGDRKIDLVKDLSQFPRGRPQETGVLVGHFPISEPQADDPLRILRELHQKSISYNSGEEDVYNLAISSDLLPHAPPVGDIDIDTADDATLQKLANTIMGALTAVDKVNGAQWLASETGGDFDFTMTGTNTAPFMLDLINTFKSKDNRTFLKLAFNSKATVARVWSNSKGVPFVSFRGNSAFRSFIQGNAIKLSSSKISVISTAIQNSNNWAGTLKSAGGRLPVISYVFVGAVDVGQWLQDPASERDLSDLIATLFVDMTKIAISAIVGAVAAAALVAFIPAWAVVSAGIGAAVVVGIGLDMLDNWLGISDGVKDIFDWIGDAIDPVMKKTEVELALEANQRMLPPNSVPAFFGSLAR